MPKRTCKDGCPQGLVVQAGQAAAVMTTTAQMTQHHQHIDQPGNQANDGAKALVYAAHQRHTVHV